MSWPIFLVGLNLSLSATCTYVCHDFSQYIQDWKFVECFHSIFTYNSQLIQLFVECCTSSVDDTVKSDGCWRLGRSLNNGQNPKFKSVICVCGLLTVSILLKMTSVWNVVTGFPFNRDELCNKMPAAVFKSSQIPLACPISISTGISDIISNYPQLYLRDLSTFSCI